METGGGDDMDASLLLHSNIPSLPSSEILRRPRRTGDHGEWAFHFIFGFILSFSVAITSVTLTLKRVLKINHFWLYDIIYGLSIKRESNRDCGLTPILADSAKNWTPVGSFSILDRSIEHRSVVDILVAFPSHILSPSETFIHRNETLVNMCLPAINRSGTLFTALAHIITAVIGSGVLTLAWSMSQLGWIAGPLTMLAVASITLASAFFLINCYKYPDHDHGPNRNSSYLDAVEAILGKKNARVCGIIVKINFIKVGIVYTITSSISMRAIQRSNCYHQEGHNSVCEYGNTYYMIIFGVVQVIVSQIPNFRNTEWLSVIAATMSFMYSTIGAALGLAQVIENGEIKGSIGGNPAPTPAKKVWAISQSLGDIAFAFPFSVIFLEVMDTLRANPPEKVTMKKASIVAVLTTTFFYICCGGFGYAAFGNLTPGNLLTGFGFYEPYWLVDLANACVVIHLVGGYQVFSQPLFASCEKWFQDKYPNSRFMTGELKQMPALRLNPLRLSFRTAYVGFTTGFALLFPYFNQIIGVAGAINFWPIVVYFPVEMYLAQKHGERWTMKSVFLRAYCFVTLIVIVFAFVGSVKGLIAARFS